VTRFRGSVGLSRDVGELGRGHAGVITCGEGTRNVLRPQNHGDLERRLCAEI
jgi:hypothetical protein